MSSYHFTPDDRIQPVYCVGCRQHIPRVVSAAGRGLCPGCLAKLQGATSPAPALTPAPVPGIYHPSTYKSPSLTWLWAVGGMVVFSVVLYAVFGKVKSDRERAKLQPVLARLKGRYPHRHFALSMRDGPVVFDAKLNDLRVKEVDITRYQTSLRAEVRFSAIHRDRSVRPKVCVTAFDEEGRELGRFAVVDHLYADLKPGMTETTTDTVRLQGDGTPVIIAVDDKPELRRSATY